MHISADEPKQKACLLPSVVTQFGTVTLCLAPTGPVQSLPGQLWQSTQFVGKAAYLHI